MISKIASVTCFVFLLIALTGCTRQSASSVIERHHQFSMAIGKMEDQIDLIQLPGQSFSQAIDIEMKNGLFFISNGASKKINPRVGVEQALYVSEVDRHETLRCHADPPPGFTFNIPP